MPGHERKEGHVWSFNELFDEVITPMKPRPWVIRIAVTGLCFFALGVMTYALALLLQLTATTMSPEAGHAQEQLAFTMGSVAVSAFVVGIVLCTFGLIFDWLDKQRAKRP